MGSTSSPREVATYVQRWTEEQLQRNDNNIAELARRVGVSRATIYAWKKLDKGIGPKNEQAFADRLFGGSVDALRKAARGESPGDVIAATQPENTELAKAVEFSRGILPDACLSDYVKTAAKQDPDAQWTREEYLEDMRLYHKRKWRKRTGRREQTFDGRIPGVSSLKSPSKK